MIESSKLIDGFARLWATDSQPELETYLAGAGAVDALQLSRLVRIDQAERWRRGERPLAEEYRERFPQLKADDEFWVDLIYHEYLLRERFGERPSLREFARRFPRHAAVLAEQVGLHRALACTSLNDSDACAVVASGESASNTHGDLGNVFKDTASELSTALALADPPGKFIGPYKLLSEIGQGGMGVVYVADQLAPVRRRVALKVIKAGMDTRQVIARFEAERQALAMMEHSNIARVFDAGTTETGHPYFVMELVHGVPATDYCDQHKLSIRERLEMFVHVCHAVQHAHQKGIIHRDLKPSNVLVTTDEGRAAPKIIDFGLAKATGQQVTGLTQFTAFAQMVGTPLYMSPEQAELSPLGVDTRSDIYSLGALLYELLTGTTPFDKDRLQRAPYDELRRIIREEEAPPPSARVGTLATNCAAAIAECRSTDARRFRQTVRGELDWIVIKCLEKDRNRRYETASSLARDIERYLHDEPVHACPPSVAYRLRKYARRNKVALAFAALFLAGFVFLAFSNIAIMRERNAKTKALAQSTTENARANAVSNLLQEMLGSADAVRAKGINYTVREMLDDFSAGLGERMHNQPEVEADIYATIGGAYRSLGMPDQAQKFLQKAIELGRDVFGPDSEKLAAILVYSGWNLQDLSKDIEAEAALREALEIYRKRGITGGPVIRALGMLQHVLISFRRYADAENVTQEAVAIASQSGEQFPEMASILHRYASMKLKQGSVAESEQLLRQALAMHRRLNGNQHPETGWALKTLADALRLQGKLEEAESALRENLAIFRHVYGHDHRFVGWVVDDLKGVLAARGDQTALDALASEEVNQAIRSDTRNDRLHLAGLLISNNPSVAQKQEADGLLRRAIDEFAQVAVDTPDNLSRRLIAAEGYIEVARICAVMPDFSNQVDEAHRRLMAELNELLAKSPNSSECQWRAAFLYRAWASAVLANGAYLSSAEQAYRASIQLFEKLSLSDPKLPRVWLLLANNLASLGEVLWRLERPEDARFVFRRAMAVYDQHLTNDDRNLPGVVVDQARAAYCLATTGLEGEADAVLGKAVRYARRLPASSASAEALYCLGVAQTRLGDNAGYRATCKTLIDMPFDKLKGPAKSRPVWTPCLGPNALEDPSLPVKLGQEFVASNALHERSFGLFILGAAHYRAGQYEHAAQRLNESITTSLIGPATVAYSMNCQRLFLSMTKWQLGQHDEARKLLAETLPAVEKEFDFPASEWDRRATLEILRREAEALIGKKGS